MNKKDKSIVLILVLMEIISFAVLRPQNLEMFSFVWAFLFLLILVYRWQTEGFKHYAIASYDVDGYQNEAIANENPEPKIYLGKQHSILGFYMIIATSFVVNLMLSIATF